MYQFYCSWIVRYKVYQYHAIRVFYISLSILYRVLLYCYSLYIFVHGINQNYICANRMCYNCVEVVCCSLCAVLCSLGCILYSVLGAAYIFVLLCGLCENCVRSVCGLCENCVYLCIYMFAGVCVCIVYLCVRTCVCVCVCGFRLSLCSTQSDTPSIWLPMRV